MPGTLFVVATPIGNLEDLTFRALRTLGEVDLIAAEDTRRTARLLAHYKISRKMVSLREHNEARETPGLLAALAGGQNIALVTDAGTPTISDPGAGLVRAARARSIRVVPIPGASAVATALSASGFPVDQFVFLGFPPASGTQRHAWFDKLAHEPRTAVFFEAPHRIKRTLQELETALVNRPIIVGRELTKVHEELVERQNNAVHAIAQRGEFTVVVGPAEIEGRIEPPDPLRVRDIFCRLTNIGAFADSEASAITGHVLGLTATEVRKALKKAMILVNQQKHSL